MNEEELQSPDFWDFDSAEVREPVRGRRTVVSVALPSADFAVVARCARERGMKLSEFIREAALEKCRESDAKADLVFTGAAGGTIVIEAKSSPVTKSSGTGELIAS